MRIIKINEQQYKSLLLNEEMHYPKFLDKIKDDVSSDLYIKINEEIKNNNFKFEYTLEYSCEYTDNIVFDITINNEEDIKDKRNYRCFYYNEYNTLYNGKLISPKIIISCPCKSHKIIFNLLKVALSHELTHLYDDWSELSIDKEGLNYKKKNQDTTKFVNNSYNVLNNEIYKSLSILAYMSLKTERQAFLSQTIQELEEVGCTLSNYHEKLKQTILYNNIVKSYKDVINFIKNATENELINCNEYIILTVPKANIPKLYIGDFNSERYRSMLSKWAERTYHATMKNYASVVQYYIDKLREQMIELNDMYIY